jgi:hypothetical protein
LFTSQPFVARAASTCRPVDRHLQANLHETHSHSQTWRCGIGNGYASNGQ